MLSYSLQQQPFLDWTVTCDEKWILCDSQWQPTSSVVGPRNSSKALPKAKFVPKEGPGHCSVVHCWSDPLQLSESQQNHYIWEVRSANWWDALKSAFCRDNFLQWKCFHSQQDAENAFQEFVESCSMDFYITGRSKHFSLAKMCWL